MTTQNSRLPWEAAGAKLNLDKVSMPSPAGMCHQDKNPARTDLEPRHRHELHSSAISDKVIDGRGYRSVLRTDTDLRHRNLLKNNGMAKAVWGNVQLCSGILMPQWSVAGERLAGMYKPDRPRTGDKGKPRKYECPRRPDGGPGRPSVQRRPAIRPCGGSLGHRGFEEGGRADVGR